MLGPQRYDDVVETRGRRLHELGPDVVGFDRGAAFAALESLNGTPTAIVRGEVVRMAGDRPEYAFSSWRCDMGVGEEWGHWCRRSLREAEEFVHHFPDPSDGSILYVFFTSGASGMRARAA